MSAITTTNPKEDSEMDNNSQETSTNKAAADTQAQQQDNTQTTKSRSDEEANQVFKKHLAEAKEFNAKVQALAEEMKLDMKTLMLHSALMDQIFAETMGYKYVLTKMLVKNI
jgi:hypothetical protein